MDRGNINLVEIIKERKERWMKKLEAKRSAHELMKSTYLRKSADEFHALGLLTEDGWEKVLEYVTSPKDLESVRNVSLFFRDLLDGRKFEKILFPLALEVDAFWSTLDSTGGDESGQRCSPKVLPVLRRVCTKWRDCIDQVHMKKLGEDDHSSSFRSMAFNLQQASNKLEAWERMAQEKKELLMRAVFVNLFTSSYQLGIRNNPAYAYDPQEIQVITPMFNAIINLFHFYGDNVVNLRVSIVFDKYSTQVSMSEFYRPLQDMLSLLPNLKYLSLYVSWNKDNKLGRRHVELLRRINQENMYSPLNIERIIVHIIGRIRPEFGLYVFQYVSGGVYDVSEFWATFLKGILDRCNNLKDFDICNSTEDTMFFKIHELSPANWTLPLRKIRVRFLGEDPVNVNEIFTHLEAFPTLEEVELDVPNCTPDLPRVLCLPNVKFIDLSLQIKPKSIDFLVKMEKLERVTLNFHRLNGRDEMSGFVRWETPNLIWFEREGSNLYESNIWQVFPYLKQVKIYVNRWIIYKREKRPKL